MSVLSPGPTEVQVEDCAIGVQTQDTTVCLEVVPQLSRQLRVVAVWAERSGGPYHNNGTV